MVSTKTHQNIIFIQKRLAEDTMKLSFRSFHTPPVRLARSRTPGFHPGNRGSNPLRDANLKPSATICAEGFLMVHRHLPRRYYSEPNGAAILLGRVDLRVDHGQFENHMKIQDAPRADNPVRRFSIGCGRHGGRPSQKQEALHCPQYTSMPLRR